MQTVNISLPDPREHFIDHPIAEGRHSRARKRVRSL